MTLAPLQMPTGRRALEWEPAGFVFGHTGVLLEDKFLLHARVAQEMAWFYRFYWRTEIFKFLHNLLTV